MMKVALTAQGPGPQSPLDERFGRCRYVIVADDSGQIIKGVPNPGLDDPSGAGVGMAQFLADEGVSAVITGRVGPKAERALDAARISVFLAPPGTVSDALAAFKRGALTRLSDQKRS